MSTRTHDLTIIPIETPSLGDRSYVVHDGEVAFVIDPQRDIDRVLDLLSQHDVRLTHVFETHIHNDYVTGGLALAERTGAAYRVNGADEVSFDRTPIADGEQVAVGTRMKVRAISTPGHTFTHLSYALTDGDEPYAVFTGGSLLFGAISSSDYPVIQAVTLIITVAVLVANYMVEILYGFIDPRIRASKSGEK